MQETLEDRDHKYDKLKTMSANYLNQQKEEFEKCLDKYDTEIKNFEKVQQQLTSKIDYITELEQEISELTALPPVIKNVD